MKNLLTLTLTIWLSVFIAATANASGGGDGDKINNPWQNVDDGACAMFTPSVLTSDNCVPDPDGVSGQDFFCTFLTTCPTGLPDDEDD